MMHSRWRDHGSESATVKHERIYQGENLWMLKAQDSSDRQQPGIADGCLIELPAVVVNSDALFADRLSFANDGAGIGGADHKIAGCVAQIGDNPERMGDSHSKLLALWSARYRLEGGMAACWA